MTISNARIITDIVDRHRAEEFSGTLRCGLCYKEMPDFYTFAAHIGTLAAKAIDEQEKREDDAEKAKELAEATKASDPDVPVSPAKSCEGFVWVGQSFQYCDSCGRPYWEHKHEMQTLRKSSSPFESRPETLKPVPITSEEAHRCRMRWDLDYYGKQTGPM